MPKRVIVIGGGAAGLMAAGKAAEMGKQVTVLEKMKKVGRKLAISGKGRCNLTTDYDVEEIIQNTPGNGNFLYSSLYTYSNQNIMDFFRLRGVRLKVERGGRVFPESDHADEIVEALRKYAIDHGVKIFCDSPVRKVLAKENSVYGVALFGGKELSCDSIVLATGGMSYPGTGSTGDGYGMAKELGHTVTALKPSLIPLIANETWIKDLQGLSLRNIGVQFKDKAGKKIYQDFGEMIFTHFGVSGPVILSASRHLLPYDYKGITIHIDLKPALDESKLHKRLLRDFEMYNRKQFANALHDLLPNKLIDVFVQYIDIPPEKPIAHISKPEREAIVNGLKDFHFSIQGSRPIKEAIVTAGGIKTNEINPSTMESKQVKGLFFAGEIIDVDAYTGGFNLTIAFSTGHMAGSNC